MKTVFSVLGVAAICLVVACGSREETAETPPVALVRAVPATGSTLDPNGTITLAFDAVPTDLSVNAGVIKADGTQVIVSGPFTPGALALTITWGDGEQTLTYTVGTPTERPIAEEIETEPIPEPDPEPIIPVGMVLIPEGPFKMGSTDGGADADEQPVHTVHLDAFYIDANEVTNAEFQEFVIANPEWQKDRIDPRFHDGNYLEDWNGNNYPLGERDHPVRYVSWYAAMGYAVWVEKRLPTEAEWEKAARGGLDRKSYPWGNGINFNRANYGKRLGETTPVAEYPPNDYGVFDMAGNVWEWCLDGYAADFYANSPLENPTAGADSAAAIVDAFEDIVAFRVIRGGGWNSEPEWLRSANRHGTSPAYAGIGALGFRCAKPVSP